MRRDLDSIWRFLDPASQDRIREGERAAARRICHGGTELWDPLKTKFANTVVLDGADYNKQMEALWIFPDEPFVSLNGNLRDNCRNSPSGAWHYANRVLPAHTWLDTYQGRKHGQVAFDTDVAIPTLYTRGYSVMASCTPMEMFTMRQGIRRATGKVLIGGLGLGWLLRLVAAKKSVKEIVVVEQSQDLLDWFGRELCTQISENTATPIKVICGDAWHHLGKHGDDTRHLLDIWEGYDTELDDQEQAKVDRVKHFWGWGIFAEPAGVAW
jgi:hypothetical protein